MNCIICRNMRPNAMFPAISMLRSCMMVPCILYVSGNHNSPDRMVICSHTIVQPVVGGGGAAAVVVVIIETPSFYDVQITQFIRVSCFVWPHHVGIHSHRKIVGSPPPVKWGYHLQYFQTYIIINTPSTDS